MELKLDNILEITVMRITPMHTRVTTYTYIVDYRQLSCELHILGKSDKF